MRLCPIIVFYFLIYKYCVCLKLFCVTTVFFVVMIFRLLFSSSIFIFFLYLTFSVSFIFSSSHIIGGYGHHPLIKILLTICVGLSNFAKISGRLARPFFFFFIFSECIACVAFLNQGTGMHFKKIYMAA
jgi:hypothetical protein